MGVLMFLIAVSLSGDAQTAFVQFDSMAECQAKRAEVMEGMQDVKAKDGSESVYFAAECVQPVRVNII